VSNRNLSSMFIWAEMVKLSHSIFALPFAVIAAFLAGRRIEGRDWPYPGQFLLVIVCMVGARSVAMTFNRIADAHIDARNPRTQERPLPTGRLGVTAAWLMLAVSAAVFIFGCLGFVVFYGNSWPILLSGPVLLFLCGYSYSKRFTKWSHIYLGLAIGLSPVAAWLAIDPASLGWPAVILMLAVTCWIGGFDIIYACQDIDIDRRDGLHSLPSRLGPRPALWIARTLHAVSVAMLLLLSPVAHLGVIYLFGVAAAAVLLIVENSLVRPGDYSKVNLAFFTMNGIVSLILAATAIMDITI